MDLSAGVILECPGGASDSAGKCILNLLKAFNCARVRGKESYSNQDD